MNIRAPHVLVATLVPAMASRGEGVVIMIGSWMASVGSPIVALYSAASVHGITLPVDGGIVRTKLA